MVFVVCIMFFDLKSRNSPYVIFFESECFFSRTLKVIFLKKSVMESLIFNGLNSFNKGMLILIKLEIYKLLYHFRGK